MLIRKKSTLLIACIFVAVGILSTACNKLPLKDSETQFSESLLVSESTISESSIIEETTPSPTPSPTPTPIPEPEHINVSFLGDCTLAEALAWNGSSAGFDAVVNGDYEYCFKNCAEILNSDDMTLANFEGAITNASSHKVKEFVFGSPFEYTEMLTFAGIESVNLANNHSGDYFEQGLTDTQNAMDSIGVKWSNQHQTAIYEVRGVKIGMCGIDMVDGDTAATAHPLIDKLKEEGCNIIIVSCHWGIEKDYSPRDTQVYTAHDLIDYGADIIVGTHPHRLQPIEKYNDKYILYSISNFCFGGNTGLSDPDTAIIQCEFIMDETNSYCVDYRLNVIPYSQTSTRPGNDYCPKPYEWGSDDYYRVMERLNWAQEDE